MATPDHTPETTPTTTTGATNTAPHSGRPETAEEWEQVRRSVAMLPPGAWAMRREQSLHALAALLATLRQTPKQ